MHHCCHGEHNSCGKNHAEGTHGCPEEQWEVSKQQWLMELTKEAYEEALKDAIEDKLEAMAKQEIEELSDIAVEKFTGWWKLKKEKIALKKRFHQRLQTFCQEED